MTFSRLIAAVGLLFLLSAVTQPAAADAFGTKDEAVALVKRAIARTAEIGMDKAKVEFMDHEGKFIDRDLYVVVMAKDGVRIVQPASPKLVGKVFFDAVDVNGKEYGKDVQQIAAGPGKGWVSYAFKDPVSGKILPKEVYIETAGDYIYLAGVYVR